MKKLVRENFKLEVNLIDYSYIILEIYYIIKY
jgi:hypothetical protein